MTQNDTTTDAINTSNDTINTTSSDSASSDNALSTSVTADIHNKLAKQLGIKTSQVNAFVKLFDEGATIPFIARYRKEKTQGLDDSQLRELEKGLNYERDMASRRAKITELLTNQGNLTEALKARIDNATSKLELEDIYLPFRPRRRSLAAKARVAGLTDAANRLLNDEITPAEAVSDYLVPEKIVDESGNEIDVDFSDSEKQLAGIEAIIIDDWTQELELLDALRTGFAKTAVIKSALVSEEKREAGEKFKDYFEHSESLARLPNHRLLAMLRGRQENVLVLKVDGEDAPFIEKIISQFELDGKQPSERREFLTQAASSLWKDKWRPHIEHRLLTQKRLAAEADAIHVFANNLQHLLMAAPAGPKVILGVDPGIRHGVKMAVIDSSGHVIYDDDNQNANTNDATHNSDETNVADVTKDTPKKPAIATVYPFAPDNKMAEAKATIAELLKKYNVDLVAIGNGTASRETDAMIKEVIASDESIKATAVVVNESGASVYSASELASEELGGLDVSIRGAVSIARRLQDPLSELVKVEPKAIGVGQYQHDVNQTQLTDSLDKVTQDCVNAVGVDVNTASPAILTHIAGLNRNVAQQIVNYRQEHGRFESREALKDVPRLGVKTFEQAAGFLRIRDGIEPLDATGVHPESYDFVKAVLEKSGKTLNEVLGNDGELNTLSAEGVAANDENFSLTTIKQELAKPAHDPRPEFKTANFRDDVNQISDLEEGMQLEGVVTNVTAFGCFVDVGVHQDGLVHISQMANDFVADPINRVKPGDIVNVRVISIDEARGRIGFSMKSDNKPSASKHAKSVDQSATQSDPKAQDKNSAQKPQQHRVNRNPNRNASNNLSNSPKRADSTKSRNKNANRSDKQKGRSEPQKIGSLGALLKEAGLGK